MELGQNNSLYLAGSVIGICYKTILFSLVKGVTEALRSWYRRLRGG
jgi:hypothetical protein